jgi:hypothetical protein
VTRGPGRILRIVAAIPAGVESIEGKLYQGGYSHYVFRIIIILQEQLSLTQWTD